MRRVNGMAASALVIGLGMGIAVTGPGGALAAPQAPPPPAPQAQQPQPSFAQTILTFMDALQGNALQANGQPNQSCGSDTAPNTPGNAASAPGSAFNPDGTAGTKYAGQQPQNSKNPVSVSQYDVACANQPN